MVSDLRWEESHFRAGSRIGKYVLEQQIGHGGMAVVFRARDDQLGRMVALKIMAPSVASDAEFRQRFVRESKAAAAVDDLHIIPLFEAGDSAGVLFIAMRYVAGGDVRSLLAREGPLSVDRASRDPGIGGVRTRRGARRWAGAPRCQAREHADRCPQGQAGSRHLADFGLTKATSGAVTLTGTGRFLGTADYAAPEQISGRRVNGQGGSSTRWRAPPSRCSPGRRPSPATMSWPSSPRTCPSLRRRCCGSPSRAACGAGCSPRPGAGRVGQRWIPQLRRLHGGVPARSRHRPIRGSRRGQSIAPQNRRGGSRPRFQRARRCSRGIRRQALGTAPLDEAARPDRRRPGPQARRALGDRRRSGCCRCGGCRRVPHARAATTRTWRTCGRQRSHGARTNGVGGPLAHLRRSQRVRHRSAAWLGRRIDDARRGPVHWGARRVCPSGRVEHAPAGECPGRLAAAGSREGCSRFFLSADLDSPSELPRLQRR